MSEATTTGQAQEDAPYSSKFFTANAVSASQSAEPVLRIVRDLYQPTSIMDLGCGSGGWLTVAGQIGFTTLRGYDGPWADPTQYVDGNIDFVALDLEKDEVPQGRYDLAMSVEVAEHISEARSDFFVDTLCAASDVVLFGAAIPFQGGTHHITERPQTFWIEKFRARGYEVFDVIRPAIWDRREIRRWFRQNTFLFVKEGTDVIDRDLLRSMERPIYDVVHPEVFEQKVVNLRQKVKDLRTEKREATQRLRSEKQELRRQLDGRSGGLRSVSAENLPAAVRPAVSRAWRALPEGVRARIRGTSA